MTPNRGDGLPVIRMPAEKRPKLKVRPIINSVQPKRSIAGADKRRLICLTHVLPYPSRAGNEYRIHRMLDWFAANGFDVFLVSVPAAWLCNHPTATRKCLLDLFEPHLVSSATVRSDTIWPTGMPGEGLGRRQTA